MRKYRDNSNKVEAHYLSGKLIVVFPVFPECDLIDWEALRHDVPFYENQIDANQFKRYQDGNH